MSRAVKPAQMRFSSSELSERDRLSFSREVFGRKIVHADIEPEPGQVFRFDIAMREFSALRVHFSTVSPLTLRRTREFLADGDDSFALVVSLAGSGLAEQAARQTVLHSRDGVLIPHMEPTSFRCFGGRVVGLVMPRAALAPLVADLDGAALQLIPKRSEALRLLLLYLGLLRREDCAFADPELRHRAVAHVHDLVALLIGASRDGAAIAGARGLRAARLNAVKRDILEHLGDQALSESAVAQRQRITPRYVRMLFEGEGTSFTAFLLEQRLGRSYRLLSDPRCAGRTVSAIAFAAGFGDLSYFNRVFRRRYGCSPSAVRASGARRPA